MLSKTKMFIISKLVCKETKYFKRCIEFQKRYKSVKWSYAHGAGVIPFTSKHIGNFVDIAAIDYGDVEAVVNNVEGVRKTYRQFVDDINKFAGGLLSLGLNPGDRVGIWSPNCYRWMIAQHAIAKAGLIMVPINPAYQSQEVDYCLGKVNMRAMIIYDQFKTQNYHQILSRTIPELNDQKPGDKITSKNHPYFERLVMMCGKELPGTIQFQDVMESSDNRHLDQLNKIQNEITMDKPVYIMFTSGTTGKPKGVVLSHHNLVNYTYTLRYRYDFGVEINRTCTVVPLFHGIGCLLITLHNLIDGHTVVLTGPSFNPGLVLKTIQEEKCTNIVAPATMYVDLLSHPDAAKTDYSTIRKVKMGGSLCPPPLLKRINDEWKCTDIFTGYGATEVSGSMCSADSTDTLEEKMFTSGRTLDYMEMKIVDPKGNIVPRGVAGEICGRGYKVMMKYWDDPEKTEQAITADGWYHTGDVGILLDNDCLQVVDRIRDMVIRGGENIYPKEIEDFLMSHPKIQEAYVIGVPDDRMGEEVCVWIQCRSGEKLTEDELKVYCKGQIAHYKIPRYVRFVEHFPKTITGKVQKHVMREEEAKLMAAK